MVTCAPTNNGSIIARELIYSYMRSTIGLRTFEAATLACARNVLYFEVAPWVSAAVDSSVGVPQLAAQVVPA
jgi:hypothetical protein